MKPNLPLKLPSSMWILDTFQVSIEVVVGRSGSSRSIKSVDVTLLSPEIRGEFSIEHSIHVIRFKLQPNFELCTSATSNTIEFNCLLLLIKNTKIP